MGTTIALDSAVGRFAISCGYASVAPSSVPIFFCLLTWAHFVYRLPCLQSALDSWGPAVWACSSSSRGALTVSAKLSLLSIAIFKDASLAGGLEHRAQSLRLVERSRKSSTTPQPQVRSAVQSMYRWPE